MKSEDQIVGEDPIASVCKALIKTKKILSRYDCTYLALVKLQQNK